MLLVEVNIEWRHFWERWCYIELLDKEVRQWGALYVASCAQVWSCLAVRVWTHASARVCVASACVTYWKIVLQREFVNGDGESMSPVHRSGVGVWIHETACVYIVRPYRDSLFCTVNGDGELS